MRASMRGSTKAASSASSSPLAGHRPHFLVECPPGDGARPRRGSRARGGLEPQGPRPRRQGERRALHRVQGRRSSRGARGGDRSETSRSSASGAKATQSRSSATTPRIPQSYYRTGVPNPDFPGVARFCASWPFPKLCTSISTGPREYRRGEIQRRLPRRTEGSSPSGSPTECGGPGKRRGASP
jgi:hypothetical protein